MKNIPMRLIVSAIVAHHRMPETRNERFILDAELNDSTALSDMLMTITILV